MLFHVQRAQTSTQAYGYNWSRLFLYVCLYIDILNTVWSNVRSSLVWLGYMEYDSGQLERPRQWVISYMQYDSGQLEQPRQWSLVICSMTVDSLSIPTMATSYMEYDSGQLEQPHNGSLAIFSMTVDSLSGPTMVISYMEYDSGQLEQPHNGSLAICRMIVGDVNVIPHQNHSLI